MDNMDESPEETMVNGEQAADTSGNGLASRSDDDHSQSLNHEPNLASIRECAENNNGSEVNFQMKDSQKGQAVESAKQQPSESSELSDISCQSIFDGAGDMLSNTRDLKGEERPSSPLNARKLADSFLMDFCMSSPSRAQSAEDTETTGVADDTVPTASKQMKRSHANADEKVDVGVDADLNAQDNVNVDVNVDADANSDLNADVDADIDVNEDTDVNVEIDADSDVDNDSDQDANIDADLDAEDVIDLYAAASAYVDGADSDDDVNLDVDSDSDDNDDLDLDADPDADNSPVSSSPLSSDTSGSPVESQLTAPGAAEAERVMQKPKPPYNWCSGYEIMRREMGLTGNGRNSLRNGFNQGFHNRFYASRHIIERMELSHKLRRHTGCVNCLNFNKAGNMLVSGSDDGRLVIWDWAGNKIKHNWKSGHCGNIFQAKFLTPSSCLDIISSARDGHVRRSIVPTAGGEVQTSPLYSHRGPVHKLVLCPSNPWTVISVGEDGSICSKDLRDGSDKIDTTYVTLSERSVRKVRLFSVSHHPLAPEICVSGNDSYVRVYDRRSMAKPVHNMQPLNVARSIAPNVTCCLYNNTGTEILASYSEEGVYLFNNKNYVAGEFLHSYKGHYNSKTIKGVNFFGPNCEYVISGSDCGNIFYWDKNTEAILNYMQGDNAGVVNCLEAHPVAPILATSGLDHNVKIWTPSAKEYPPSMPRLRHCVKRNLMRACDAEVGDFSTSVVEFIVSQLPHRQRLNHYHRGSRHRGNRSNSSSDEDYFLHRDSDSDEGDMAYNRCSNM